MGQRSTIFTQRREVPHDALAVAIAVGREQSRRHFGRQVDVVARVRGVRRDVRAIRSAVAGDLVQWSDAIHPSIPGVLSTCLYTPNRRMVYMVPQLRLAIG